MPILFILITISSIFASVAYFLLIPLVAMVLYILFVEYVLDRVDSYRFQLA